MYFTVSVDELYCPIINTDSIIFCRLGQTNVWSPPFNTPLFCPHLPALFANFFFGGGGEELKI